MTFDTLFNTLIKDLSQTSCSPYVYYPAYQNCSKQYEVFEEDNNIVFRCLASGLKQKDIDITFDKKKLCIQTSAKETKKSFTSSINKNITLNRSIDVKNSFARLDEGILTVTMPLDKTDVRQKISFK